MANEKQLLEYAKAGDTEALVDTISQIEPDQEEGMNLTYEWLQVAAAYGSEEAEEMADDLYETVLQVDDETVACLHFEVAQWFIEGTHGIEKNVNHGLEQLRRAADLQLVNSIQDIEKELMKLREQLPKEAQIQFNEIFPEL